jgi:cation:H+ antiporter
MPVMLIVALLLLPVLYNLVISRPEGIVLLIIFFAMIVFTILQARRQVKTEPEVEMELSDEIKVVKKVRPKALWLSIVLIAAGLVGLAVGADITLRGAVVIGEKAGLSKAVIGMTIVALGTSLPELATCLTAAFKGQDDISIGNLVGSNIFNTLLVTGTAGVISPSPLSITSRLVGTDYWIMVAVSIMFMIMALIGKKISRTNGAILFCVYIGYIVYLFAFTAGV